MLQIALLFLPTCVPIIQIKTWEKWGMGALIKRPQGSCKNSEAKMTMVFPFSLYTFPGMILGMEKLKCTVKMWHQSKIWLSSVKYPTVVLSGWPRRSVPESSLRIPPTMSYVSRGLLLSPLLVWKVLVIQSWLTLCNPMDSGMPGFSVHGILQARILGWVAIPFSRGSSQLQDRIWVSLLVSVVFIFEMGIT